MQLDGSAQSGSAQCVLESGAVREFEVPSLPQSGEAKPSGKSWRKRRKIPGHRGARDKEQFCSSRHTGSAEKIVPFLAGLGVAFRCGFVAGRSYVQQSRPTWAGF